MRADCAQTGVFDMTMIKSREPTAEVEPTTGAEVEGEIREFVRRDTAILRRQPETDSDESDASKTIEQG